MSSAVIVGFKRSPFTIARKGNLANVRPEDILSQVINDLVKSTNINKDHIEDIIAGCAYPEGEQGFNIAKIVSFMTDMPEHVAGMTVNRWCGSSMQSIHIAAGAIAMNAGNAFICCGIESMSKVPINGLNYSPHSKLNKSNPNVYLSMGNTAENVAKKYDFSREAQQDFSISSHKKAFNAQNQNYFNDELTSIHLENKIIELDEAIRPNTSQEILNGLKLVFDENGTVTAGTSSPLTDGAAATLVCNENYAKKNNLPILAKIISTAVNGCPPELMGLGPIGATKKDILTQFLMEAVFLSEFGGIVGIILGVAGGNVVAILLNIPAVIPLDWAFIGLLVCSVIGIGFGIYPAWRAAQLDPIESLRFE